MKQLKENMLLVILATLIIGFGIVIYQNKKQLDYLWSIDTIIRGINVDIGVIHEYNVKGL